MTEHWIIYDLASGEELRNGSGPQGWAQLQQVPEGAALAIVPQEVLDTLPRDLDALRTWLAVRIDAEAEKVRLRFLTPGAGQALTYQRKEAEARAWLVDNSAAVPFLTAEAPARGMTIAALASEVVGLADAWVAVGSAIEALRMGAKADLGVAEKIGHIIEAARIDWDAVGFE